MFGDISGAIASYHTPTERHPYLDNSCAFSEQSRIDVHNELGLDYIDLDSLPQVQGDNEPYQLADSNFGANTYDMKGTEFGTNCPNYLEGYNERPFLQGFLNEDYPRFLKSGRIISVLHSGNHFCSMLQVYIVFFLKNLIRNLEIRPKFATLVSVYLVHQYQS